LENQLEQLCVTVATNMNGDGMKIEESKVNL